MTTSAPEEDEVALVVEGGDLAAAEGRVLVEQARQLAAQAVPQPRAKPVQHQLRLRARRAPMALEKRQFLRCYKLKGGDSGLTRPLNMA